MWWLSKQSDDKQLPFINFIEGVPYASGEDSEEMGSVYMLQFDCTVHMKQETSSQTPFRTYIHTIPFSNNDYSFLYLLRQLMKRHSCLLSAGSHRDMRDCPQRGVGGQRSAMKISCIAKQWANETGSFQNVRPQTLLWRLFKPESHPLSCEFNGAASSAPLHFDIHFQHFSADLPSPTWRSVHAVDCSYIVRQVLQQNRLEFEMQNRMVAADLSLSVGKWWRQNATQYKNCPFSLTKNAMFTHLCPFSHEENLMTWNWIKTGLKRFGVAGVILQYMQLWKELPLFSLRLFTL